MLQCTNRCHSLLTAHLNWLATAFPARFMARRVELFFLQRACVRTDSKHDWENVNWSGRHHFALLFPDFHGILSRMGQLLVLCSRGFYVANIRVLWNADENTRTMQHDTQNKRRRKQSRSCCIAKRNACITPIEYSSCLLQ